MAAGLTRRQKYNRTVSRLRAFGRKLSQANVPSVYKDWELSGEHAGHKWKMWYSWGNMSNGESVGLLQIRVDGKKVEPGRDGVKNLVQFLQVPADFEVQPLGSDENPPGKTTCGNCHLSWDDDIPTTWTPVPSGRCPFEYFHINDED